MLKDSCKKSLVMFAIPIILSLLTQQFYNLCDTLIVGRMLGADMLSAVGNAGTIINITTIVWADAFFGCHGAENLWRD